MTETGVPPVSRPASERNLHWALQHVEEALRGLAFGTVTLVVQDGVVIQVERTERRRFPRPSEVK
jgi:hypothetical protein